jgi:hypothetical protein
MKKTLLALTIITSGNLCGMMELAKDKTHTFTLTTPERPKTKIKLVKNNHIYDTPAQIYVVGIYEQRALGRPDSGYYHNAGDIYQLHDNSVHIKNKEIESGSEDDTYTPYDNNKKLWPNTYTKILQNPVIGIVEPQIFAKKNHELDTFEYTYHQTANISYNGAEAIDTATQALYLCNKKALKMGEFFPCQNGSEKSIALPTLGTSTGIPRDVVAATAVAAVIDYIIEHPHVYNSIYLVVKKRSEFQLYQDLINKVLNGSPTGSASNNVLK